MSPYVFLAPTQSHFSHVTGDILHPFHENVNIHAKKMKPGSTFG